MKFRNLFLFDDVSFVFNCVFDEFSEACFFLFFDCFACCVEGESDGVVVCIGEGDGCCCIIGEDEVADGVATEGAAEGM